MLLLKQQTIWNNPKSPTINRSHPKPPRNYPKLLSSPESLATPPRNKPPNLTMFFTLLTLNNQESRIKKNVKNLAMIMNHKDKSRTLSHIFRDNFKTSLQHIFEWDCWWWCSIFTPTYTAPSDLRQLPGTMRHTTNDPLGNHYIIQSRDWLVIITDTSSEIRNSCTSSIRPTAQYLSSDYQSQQL